MRRSLWKKNLGWSCQIAKGEVLGGGVKQEPVGLPQKSSVLIVSPRHRKEGRRRVREEGAEKIVNYQRRYGKCEWLIWQGGGGGSSVRKEERKREDYKWMISLKKGNVP